MIGGLKGSIETQIPLASRSLAAYAVALVFLLAYVFSGAALRASAQGRGPNPCRAKNTDATVAKIALAHYTNLPPITADAGLSLIRVTLDAGGIVTATSVYRSSGSLAIDIAAIKAAEETHYNPQILNCKSVRSDYVFQPVFSSRYEDNR
jgi:TonB family protein